MKKFLIFIITVCIMLSSLLCVPASATYNNLAESLELHSENYILMSLDNNSVIFESNADKQLAPASLTKICTAAVVLDNCDDLSVMVAAPEYCIAELAGTGSSTAGIKAGEEMSISDLLHCLLIESANDAALILADYVGQGDIDTFVGMMNDLAKKIGCKNTSFVNPHGLDDDYQFSTPRDIAKLAIYALKYSQFKEIVSLTSYTVPETNMHSERTIINTNRLMNSAYADYYCKYASGVKTGSTSKAGKCVCSTASYNGYNYIGVVMNAPEINIDDDTPLENCAFVDCKAMFNWAIKNLELVKIADSDEICAEVPVKLARNVDYVTLAPSEDIYELVPTGTDENNVLIQPVEDTMPASIKAPVKKGDAVCKADILYGGESIATIDLVATNNVSRSILLSIGYIFGRIFGSIVMKIIGAVILFALIVLISLHVKSVMRKRKNEELHIVTYKDIKK